MKSKKILENFEPFTEVWYDMCYYHALFPIVTHFNQNINYFLCNNVYAFHFKKLSNKPILELMNLSTNTIDSLLPHLGITTQRKITDDIISELIKSIASNCPVILDVDCFYESFRVDAYQKNHWAHDILFYGYNKELQIFYIIEHDFRESTQFKKRTISFTDTENSYYGYLENIKQNKNFYTFSFHQKNVQIHNFDYKKKYITNYRKFNDTINYDLTQILSFRDEIIKIEDTIVIETFYPILLTYLNNLVNRKRIQQYSLTSIFSLPNELANFLNETLSIWSTIRGIIAKSVVISNYTPSSLIRMTKKLTDAYNAEKKLNRYITDFLIS